MTTLEIYPGTTGMQESLRTIARLTQHKQRQLSQVSSPRAPLELLRTERETLDLARQLADLKIARQIVLAHLDSDFQRRAARQARARLRSEGIRGAIRSRGRRRREIQLRGGLKLVIKTPYLAAETRGQRGPRRRTGNRGPNGVGALPLFEALGIEHGMTPESRSEIARQVVLCASYQEAQDQLARSGLKLHSSILAEVACQMGTKCLDLRDSVLGAEDLQRPAPGCSPLAGKRVRVSIDGGRARTRRTRRGPGIRPGRNGRRPFDLSWREPRLITIDLFDAEGRKDRSWRPIYETSLGNADEVFELLGGLLRHLGADQAEMVLFVSDGARWIWDRLDALIEEIGIESSKVERALDFYHATEHLATALSACRSLKESERASLFKRLRRKLLEAEGLDKVMGELKALARGRRAGKIQAEIAHLERHREHTRYAELRARKIPIGSGVVESAIRRVVNLRFKSGGQCWVEERLGGLLYLRAQAKAGRWEDMVEGYLKKQFWLLVESGLESETMRAAA